MTRSVCERGGKDATCVCSARAPPSGGTPQTPCDPHNNLLVSNRSSPLCFYQESTLSGAEKEKDIKSTDTESDAQRHKSHDYTKACNDVNFPNSIIPWWLGLPVRVNASGRPVVAALHPTYRGTSLTRKRHPL